MNGTKKDKFAILENLKAGINATLPLILFIALLSWAFKIAFGLVKPFIILLAPRAEDQTTSVKLAALLLALFFIFLIGALVRSTEGRRLFNRVENRIFRILPGYTVVKETLLQFLGTKRTPFSRVAIVNTFGTATRQIGFITDDNDDGSYTVFVPTGPNPTSGSIYILPRSQVQLVNANVELAMKAIITGGIGSRVVLRDKSEEEE